MFNNIIKISLDKKIFAVLMLELIFCFAIQIKLNKPIFILAIIMDIALILGIIIFYSDSALIACTLVASFSLTYLSENLGLPLAIKYVQDVFIIMMAVKILIFYLRKNKKNYNIYFIFILFIIFSALSCIYNQENIGSYLKTLYFDYVRFYIVGIFIINSVISESKIKKYIKILWYALLIQIPLVIIQYFRSMDNWVAKNPGDIRQDYLSGIIGGRGTTELGLLITIALSILFLLYLYNDIKLIYFIICNSLLIAIAMLAEIKFILILLPLTFLSIVLIKFNLKSLSVLTITIIFLIIGGIQLTKLYPEFSNFFNVQAIEKYSGDAYASSGVGRTNSFIIANDAICSNFQNTIFGYSIGCADKISKKYKYSAFNVSQYMIECGYSGVILIYGFYLYIIGISFKLMKTAENDFQRNLGYSGFITAEVIIVATFYNRSMVKINFAIFAWMTIGLVYKCYYLNKQNRINTTSTKNGSVSNEIRKTVSKCDSTNI